MTDVLELLGSLTKKKLRGGHEWFRFSNHDVRTDEVMVEIYDDIGHYGITAADFTAALAGLPKSTKTINLRINSGGGSVFEGLTIASRLREHKAQVNVTIDGVAASIASVIAMAGDQVTMARGSQLMIHNPSGLCLGEADEMDQMAALLRKLARDTIADAYMAKAGGTADDWLARMRAETWYSGPEDRTTHDLTAYGFLHAGRGAAPDPAVTDRSIRSRAALARIQESRKGRK
jgi:ATP-dependent protease ClpP protease subunit